jgi:hypothetical protein
MLSFFKKRKKETAKIIIVDEGTASYYRTSSFWKNTIKHIMVKLLLLNHLNSSAYYGIDPFYDEAMALFPEKSVFDHDIYELPPLSESLPSLFPNLSLKSDCAYFIYLSDLLDRTAEIKIQEELKVLKRIRSVVVLAGIAFRIKPHPVQSVDIFSSVFGVHEIIDPDIPAEVLFTPNTIIASTGSSALINSALMKTRTLNISALFGITASALSSLNWLHISEIKTWDALSNYLNKQNYGKN